MGENKMGMKPRVLRGGSWVSHPQYLNSNSCARCIAKQHFTSLGFRLILKK